MDEIRYNAERGGTANACTIEMIRQLAEGMPGGFFIYHADGDEELIYINSAILRIFGCDTQQQFRELTGFTFRGMVYAEDVEAVEESIWEQIAKDSYDLDYVEYRIVQRDGSVRWVEDYGHFMHTEEYGDVFYVFIDDATERMRKRIAELEEVNEELRRAYAREMQYKKAILHDTLYFLEVNLTKDTFTCASAQTPDEQMNDLLRLMGIPAYGSYSEYVARCEENMVSGDAGAFGRFCDAKRLIQCYRKGELEQSCDGWMIDAMGCKRLCHYVFLLGSAGDTKDVVALAIVKDITEQSERQTLLQSALRQAQTAGIARNTFLFHMSHDIRTPLNAIIGYAELAKGHADDPDRLSEYMDKIHLSGEQLLAIVNESLEITRMESGRAKLVESPCRLEELLEDVEKELRPQMKAKAIRFAIDKSAIRHFAVVADYIRIKEILNQLLDNAVKYTPPNGEIRLSIVETDVKRRDYGKYEFIVEDNGNGISEDFMADLFNPFKRERNTTKSGVFGTGLGLAVVKNLVDMMEGDIAVESRVGQGSKFTVSLLLKLQEEARQEETEDTEALPDEKALRGRRILLVEDNEINCEIAEELLCARGYVVETANDGSVALDIMRNALPGYYSLILMDIQMPIMDGYAAAKAIRSLDNAALAEIPIIALSANTFAEDYQKSIEAGMNAHFPKPINMDELQDTIRSVLK
ncbi:MAG: ATP-binding protein [Roseburia sp.]|nr:ATP-binding protein [Roseburia sp.]